MRALVILILLLPVVSGEPGIDNPEGAVASHLAIHLSQVQDSVLSPLAVPDHVEHSLGLGVATHSACVPLPLQTFTEGQHHTWYAVLSTAPVEYRDDDAAATSQGPTADIHLGGDLTLTWFMETGLSSARPGPAVVPRVVLEAQLREGDDISVDHRALEAGRVVAHGRTEPADLSPALDGHPQVRHIEADGRHIYAFTLPLDLDKDPVVARQEGMHLRLDAYIEAPGCQEGHLMPDWVFPYTAPGFRPGLDFLLDRPLEILRLAPAIHNDTLLVHAELGTPWGLADVGPATVTIDVEGPGEAHRGQLVARSGGRLVAENGTDRMLGCACHPDDRVEVQQFWDVSKATAGTYTVRFAATNRDGTAHAKAETTFDLPGGATTVCRASPDGAFCQRLDVPVEKSSPAVSLAALVALAGLALRLGNKR